MTQMTNDIYAVEVPEGAKDIKILPGQPEILDYDYPGECRERDTQWLNAMIDLPPGNWQIICTANECTDEQAKGLVKELPVGLRWMNYNGDYPIWWHSAKESLRSLLTSKGLDVNKDYVLIKKQTP